MNSMRRKLCEMKNINKNIQVAIVGAGKMGKGLINQMSTIDGMHPRVISNRTVKKAEEALISSGIKKDNIFYTKNIREMNKIISRGDYVITDDYKLVSKLDAIDAVVDATGNPELGANLALDAIENKKHIIMLNVEADSVVGPILNKYAKENNVIYTGTAGDEPGSMMELYDFAKSLGFKVLAGGKGKNNPIDLSATPDTVKEVAIKKGLKPSMLAGFIDGTNTMIEMTCMANATGLIPDIRGCHGVKSDIKELKNILKLEEDGGVLKKYGVVEYVLGIAPGVFIIFTTDKEEVHDQLQYLNMGEGPNYVLYRPYHLTSLETPITIFDACIKQCPTIAPDYGQVADAIAVAKKDLKAGDRLDYIGGYTFYGSIENHKIVLEENLLPVGLIDKDTYVLEPIKKGEYIKRNQVKLDENKTIYKLRKKQDEIL